MSLIKEPTTKRDNNGVLSEIEEMKILTQQGPVNANLRGDLAEGQGVGEVTSTTRAVSKAKATKAAYDKRKREKARQRKAEAAKKAEDKQILEALSAMSIDPKISDTNGTSGANSPKPDISGPLFEIKESPGRGLGMFARRAIKEGTEILREAPFINAQRSLLSIEAGFQTLSEEKKKKFLALHSRCTCKKRPCDETLVMRIWNTNSFDIKPNKADDGVQHTFVFELASRINHSCLPNTTHGFTKELFISFQVVRDIQEGEELTHDYLGAGRFPSRVFRRQAMSERYGFHCCCTACAGNQDLTRISIKGPILRDEMRQFEKRTKGAEVLNKPTLKELEKMEEAEEWIAGLAKIWEPCSEMLKNRMDHLAFLSITGQISSVTRLYPEIRSWVENGMARAMEENNKFELSDGALRKCVMDSTEATMAMVKAQLEKIEKIGHVQ